LAKERSSPPDEQVGAKGAVGTANLVEIFSSIQGEGPDVGAATLFVRFGGCDLRCRWCDSAYTWQPVAECRIETARSSGQWWTRPNPLPVDEIVAAAQALDAKAHRFVSLTGGEPLLQPKAVRALAEALRRLGPMIHLETHGLASEALEGVVGSIDVVSMDWKLVSDVRRASDPPRGAAADFHDAHERFLEIAKRASRAVVKLVITPRSRDVEIDEAVARIARVHGGATLVLQPVTPCGGTRQRPTAERMLVLSERAGRRLADVRVIPQTHPIYGVR
jgi:7-carboxy-7-deazaguanine synthase